MTKFFKMQKKAVVKTFNLIHCYELSLDNLL